jgi:hypothetical protein
MKNIGSFTLYKNFTLFEIVNELVSKEEPSYFEPLPQPCKKTLRNPNPRKEAHHIQREMQWCDKLMYWVSNCLDPLNSAVWQLLTNDSC